MDLYSYAYFFFFFCTRTSLSFSLFTQFSLSVGCHGLNIRPTRLGRWLIVPSPNLSSMAAVNSSQVFWALFRCSLAWSLLLDWSVCVCSRERIGDQREAFLHLHPLHVSSHLSSWLSLTLFSSHIASQGHLWCFICMQWIKTAPQKIFFVNLYKNTPLSWDWTENKQNPDVKETGLCKQEVKNQIPEI